MNCDSHQGDVNGIRKVCQLRERCDGHKEDVKVLGEVTVVKKCEISERCERY